MLQLGQHMPRKQIALRCMRIAREDERLHPHGLVRTQFRQHLIGIADDRRAAA